ncbi:MAG: hypothetical protein LBS52_09740 [Dysgonamonadaceae bacterium]|jgi:hypothetical protein|nr:hypothetical protein [Dysgonamonadaceae bacterium]
MGTLLKTSPKYITDKRGRKISVILPIKEYRNMTSSLEELEDICLYDEAKKHDEPTLAAEEVFASIEQKRLP